MLTDEYVKRVYAKVEERDPDQTEFLQAVQDGSEDIVRTELTHELRTFFSEYVEKL